MRRGPARREGFTLIEVIGAVLIFSIGALMVLQITSSLSARTEYAAVGSTINVLGQQRLDSLSVLTFASVSAGSVTDTLTVRGIPYRRQLVVTQTSPLLKRLDLTLSPLTPGWPTFDASTYLRDSW